MVEHLGLLPSQPAFDRKTQPTAAMHPAPEPHVYDWGSAEDKAVEDVLSDEFEKLWVGTGRGNREAFEKVFRPVPNDTIKTWKDYVNYLKPAAGISVGDQALSSMSSPISRRPVEKDVMIKWNADAWYYRLAMWRIRH